MKHFGWWDKQLLGWAQHSIWEERNNGLAARLTVLDLSGYTYMCSEVSSLDSLSLSFFRGKSPFKASFYTWCPASPCTLKAAVDMAAFAPVRWPACHWLSLTVIYTL